MGSWTPIKYSEGVTWPKGTFWCVRASQKVLSGFSIHLMEKFSKLFGQPNTLSRSPSIPPLPLFLWYGRHWYSNVQLIDLDTADVAYSESCWAPGHAWRYGSHTTPNCLQHRRIFVLAHPGVAWILAGIRLGEPHGGHDQVKITLLSRKFHTYYYMGFPGGSVAKNLPVMRGFDPWVGKIPWRRKWQLTPIFLPGDSHEQRILVGYSSWGRKETQQHAHTILV